jgi:hypothetical protein
MKRSHSRKIQAEQDLRFGRDGRCRVEVIQSEAILL